MILRSNGWTAEPAENDGYWIKDSRGAVRAHCPTKETAEKHLDEMSGAAYLRLPEVKRNEIEVIVQPKIPTFQFPYRGWYQHTVYKYKGQEIGRIQVKYMKKRTTVSTLGPGSTAVLGGQLEWLCRMAGLRLVD